MKMRINRILPLVGLFLLHLTLSGCNPEVRDSVSYQVRDDFQEATEAMQRARSPMKTESTDTVQVSEDIWLGDSSITMPNKDPLPKKFETPYGITLATEDPLPLKEIASKIHYLTGIPVRVDDLGGEIAGEMSLSYTGPLSGLLKQIATQMNFLWYYYENEIVFYRQETKTFTVYSLPTTMTFSANVGSDNRVSIEQKEELDEWAELEDSIKDMVFDGKVTASPSTGTITVTSAPSTLKRVGKYIREQNRRLAKQVAIDVRVLQVALTDEDNYGLNLDLVFNNNEMKTSLSPISVENVAGGLNMAILSSKATGLGYFNSSNIVIDALSKQGKASLLTSGVVTTRNNRVAPIDNTQTISYIDEITSTSNDSSTSEGVTPEEEDVGFSMQLLPRILDNGRLMLMFTMSIKDIVDWQTLTTGSGSNAKEFQRPIIENKKFIQEIVMESGQTLILTGFERVKNSDSQEGLGSPNFKLLGGSRQTDSNRNVLVVIITPRILVSPLDPESRTVNYWGTPSIGR